jgi:hypothetical protein
MRFQRKRFIRQIKDILKSNDEETAIKKIVEIIKGEHIAKEHFRIQRDNTMIALQDRKDMGY